MGYRKHSIDFIVSNSCHFLLKVGFDHVSGSRLPLYLENALYTYFFFGDFHIPIKFPKEVGIKTPILFCGLLLLKSKEHSLNSKP